MKRLLVTVLPALLFLTPAAHADTKMDVILQQGVSEYESGNYNASMDHFTAALVYGIHSDKSLMYPAAYLCASWYFGHGVKQDQDRAKMACDLVKGDKSAFQLQLFQQVLEKNSAPDSTFAFKKALHDAAVALKWYIKTYVSK